MFQLPKSTNLKYAKFTGFLKAPQTTCMLSKSPVQTVGVPAAPGLDSGRAPAPRSRRTSSGLSRGLSKAHVPHLPEGGSRAAPGRPRGQGEKGGAGPTASGWTGVLRGRDSDGDINCHWSEALVLCRVGPLTPGAGSGLGNCLACLSYRETESQTGQGASIVNGIIPPTRHSQPQELVTVSPPTEKGLCRGDVKPLQRGCEPGLLRWPPSRHRSPEGWGGGVSGS